VTMTHHTSFARIVVATTLAVAGVAAAGCGQAELQGFSVTMAPVVDCTLTGATSRDCVDDTTLAQTVLTGRWIVERQPQESFTMTTEAGITLPGIFFPDDGTVLLEDPCLGAGGGGTCMFARRKFESIDSRDNNCLRFGELVAILLRGQDGSFSGILADQSGADENCGTSTIVQRIFNVSGTPDEEVSLARQEILE